MPVKSSVAGLALAALIVAPVSAQQAVIQISGQAWETGGFPSSDVGDELQAVGIVNDIDAPLFWQPTLNSYTFYVEDLVSLGESVFGNTHVVNYSGGTLSIYRDNFPSNHDYGINPPNATSPSTFIDNTAVYLSGVFTDFTLTYNTATSSGSFAGTLNFTGGLVFGNLINPNGWTLGSDIQGFSPTGYDLQLNGSVYTNGPVSTDEVSWSRTKNLYR